MVELDFFPTDKQLLLTDILREEQHLYFFIMPQLKTTNQIVATHVLIQYVRQKDMNRLHSSSLICSNLEQINEERMNIQLLFKSRIEVIWTGYYTGPSTLDPRSPNKSLWRK